MKNYHQSIFLKILILSIGVNTSTFNTSQAEEINAIIKTFCLEGVKNEMLTFNSPIKSKDAEHTCNLFIQRISNGEKVKSAKDICRTKTSKEFSL